MAPSNEENCSICDKSNGTIIFCDKCPKSYHLRCHKPSMRKKDIPEGEWYCSNCTQHERKRPSSAAMSNSSAAGRKRAKLKKALSKSADSDSDSDVVLKDESDADENDDSDGTDFDLQRNQSTSTSTLSSASGAPSSQVHVAAVQELRSSEDEEDEEPLIYFAEYAGSSRSKCKSCSKKIAKGELRIGVTLNHTQFGRTTYFKVLKCKCECGSYLPTDCKQHVQCLSLAIELPDDWVITCDVPSCPIRGLESLEGEDRSLIQDLLKKAQVERDNMLNEESTEDVVPMQRQPESLVVPLLPYQKEALSWMSKQEESEYRGGILADEMGLGKTVQALSLILHKKIQKNKNVSPSFKGKAAYQEKPAGGTVVVCPVIALMQWKSEIEKFIEEGALSVCVYHGPKRHTLAPILSHYDVVLTTYSILEYDFRSSSGLNKILCKYCNKKYRPDRLAVHQRYFCGPQAKKTLKQKKQQKKKNGVEKNVDSSLQASTSKCSDDPVGPVGNNSKDSIEEEEKVARKSPTKKSPLHEIFWERVVLDEAHYVKDRNCNTAKSTFALKSKYRWCLTGTPLQNRIGELYSLVRFLQVYPYGFYFCSACSCNSLEYSFDEGKCTSCGHSKMHHYSHFNRNFVYPVQGFGYVAEGKLAMSKLRKELLNSLLLRRTKKSRVDDICLPPKLVTVRRDVLDERENDFYEAIYTQSTAQFNTYVASGTLLNNYAHIFDLLIRLRQAVDHPYLVLYSSTSPPTETNGTARTEATIYKPLNQEDKVAAKDLPNCSLCHEEVEDPATAECGDSFCRLCIEAYINDSPEGFGNNCPVCSKQLTISFEESDKRESNEVGSRVFQFKRKSIMNRIGSLKDFQSSTKIEALMEELQVMREADASAKAIVFSQFVNMLDLIEYRLKLGNIRSVKLQGGMNVSARDKMISSFRNDPDIPVFLISLKAGGVALNLTSASRIFLMDPWWSPAAEQQAIDRTHRLGQFKPIQATRFIIANTIEERILKLQEKKQLIFDSTIGGNNAALGRLTEADLCYLFSS